MKVQYELRPAQAFLPGKEVCYLSLCEIPPLSFELVMCAELDIPDILEKFHVGVSLQQRQTRSKRRQVRLHAVMPDGFKMFEPAYWAGQSLPENLSVI